MSRRRIGIGLVLSTSLVAGLLMRAVTAHSVGDKPFIYRITANNNDLDGISGIGTPAHVVGLLYRQRNFKEGAPGTSDAFSWCAWKNNGEPIFVAWATVFNNGIFSFKNLRSAGNTVMLFPPSANEDGCSGGIYTELLLRQCDKLGIGAVCTDAAVPTLEWLNVRKLSPTIGAAAGSITGASQAAISVADGPDDGPEPSDVVDVDQNGLDTTQPGLVEGQTITWRCGAGGTASCPSITVHDGSTITETDPEFPYVLGTIQGHRPGGSVIAAAAIPRGSPIGFSVNVNVKFRGSLDVNLGCDQKKFFDFSVPLTF
jgi:hypothetical protein